MDTVILRLVNQWAGWGSPLDYLAYFLGRTAGASIYLLILLYLWFRGGEERRQDRHLVLLTAASSIFALGLAQLPMSLVYRPRPFLEFAWVFNLLGENASPSFPSSHAAAAAAFALQISWGSPVRGLLVWPLSIAVSATRVYAGVHYPSDVLAGVAVGLGAAWFFLRLAPRLEPALDSLSGTTIPPWRP